MSTTEQQTAGSVDVADIGERVKSVQELQAQARAIGSEARTRSSEYLTEGTILAYQITQLFKVTAEAEHDPLRKALSEKGIELTADPGHEDFVVQVVKGVLGKGAGGPRRTRVSNAVRELQKRSIQDVRAAMKEKGGSVSSLEKAWAARKQREEAEKNEKEKKENAALTAQAAEGAGAPEEAVNGAEGVPEGEAAEAVPDIALDTATEGVLQDGPPFRMTPNNLTKLVGSGDQFVDVRLRQDGDGTFVVMAMEVSSTPVGEFLVADNDDERVRTFGEAVRPLTDVEREGATAVRIANRVYRVIGAQQVIKGGKL